jgi:hypothetical protein
MDQNRGGFSLRRLGHVEISDLDMGCLVCTRAGVVEEKQHGMISATLGHVRIRGRQQGVHLRFLEVAQQRPDRFLERDGTDLPAPLDLFRVVFTDEECQGMNRRQTLIARPHTTASPLFQFAQTDRQQAGETHKGVRNRLKATRRQEGPSRAGPRMNWVLPTNNELG